MGSLPECAILADPAPLEAGLQAPEQPQQTPSQPQGSTAATDGSVAAVLRSANNPRPNQLELRGANGETKDRPELRPDRFLQVSHCR